MIDENYQNYRLQSFFLFILWFVMRACVGTCVGTCNRENLLIHVCNNRWTSPRYSNDASFFLVTGIHDFDILRHFKWRRFFLPRPNSFFVILTLLRIKIHSNFKELQMVKVYQSNFQSRQYSKATPSVLINCVMWKCRMSKCLLRYHIQNKRVDQYTKMIVKK